MTACLVWRGRRVPQARSTNDEDEARVGSALVQSQPTTVEQRPGMRCSATITIQWHTDDAANEPHEMRSRCNVTH